MNTAATAVTAVAAVFAQQQQQEQPQTPPAPLRRALYGVAMASGSLELGEEPETTGEIVMSVIGLLGFLVVVPCVAGVVFLLWCSRQVVGQEKQQQQKQDDGDTDREIQSGCSISPTTPQ